MSKPKILAYYLPAFHRIKENDEWYGENFTEWDNTRRAKKMFKGHNQPRVPLEYYDLSNVEVTKKQMKLAKEYGVDGFIYYHYWFNEEGRTVLEKPAEHMRDMLNDDEKIEYCFCWANQEWRKTWHEGRGGTSELLIEQEYGGEKDWDNHFEYLLPFFKDNKYIKINGSPMITILRPEDIKNYDEMVDYWNDLAKKNGFNGIHFVRTRMTHNSDSIDVRCDALVDFEPNYTLSISPTHGISNLWRIKTFLFWHLSRWDWYVQIFKNKVNYRSFYNSMKRKKYNNIDQYYYGIFVDWDNSPRKGRRGTIFVGSSPTTFGKELNYYMKLSEQNNVEFIFLFAWNEWGEGGYLEPDTKNNDKYLDIIKHVKDCG